MTELDKPVRGYLAEVAAPNASVTGGHVSAVTVAAAAGLAAMAAGLCRTLDDTDAIEANANQIREKALMLATADTEAYRAVSDAQRLEPSMPTRKQAIADALVAAAQPPRRITRLAAEVASIAALLAAQGNPRLRGDAISAATLAAGAARSAATLARINLTTAGLDPVEAQETEHEADSAAQSARAALTTAGIRTSVP